MGGVREPANALISVGIFGRYFKIKSKPSVHFPEGCLNRYLPLFHLVVICSLSVLLSIWMKWLRSNRDCQINSRSVIIFQFLCSSWWQWRSWSVSITVFYQPGFFPDNFRCAYIMTLIRLISSDLRSYRPILNLQVASKLLVSFLAWQVIDCTESKNLLLTNSLHVGLVIWLRPPYCKCSQTFSGPMTKEMS